MKAFYILSIIALLVRIGWASNARIDDIGTKVVSWREDLRNIYQRTYWDGYKRRQILTYYASSCTGNEESHYLRCVRYIAAQRGLGSGLQSSTLLKDVCCFFWDTFDCNYIMDCKPLWREMYEYYITDRIIAHCSQVPRNSLLCEVDPDRSSKVPNWFKDPLPQRTKFYGLKQNWINFFRQLTTPNKL